MVTSLPELWCGLQTARGLAGGSGAPAGRVGRALLALGSLGFPGESGGVNQPHSPLGLLRWGMKIAGQTVIALHT